MGLAWGAGFYSTGMLQRGLMSNSKVKNPMSER